MSKELINEIESKIAWNDMNINETSISLRDVKRLLNELEEQVERLEEQTERVEELERKIERYRETLKFYADEETYETKFATDTDDICDPFTLIELDNGEKARQALESDN